MWQKSPICDPDNMGDGTIFLDDATVGGLWRWALTGVLWCKETLSPGCTWKHVGSCHCRW